MKLTHTILNSIKLAAQLALALSALAVSEPQARGGDQVPFRAEWNTELETVVQFPIASVFAKGSGRATHLGRLVIESIDEKVDLVTGKGNASYLYTAANGDEIVIEFLFSAIPSGTVFTINGVWQITSGTGRFFGASGSGTYEGFVEFTGPTSGLGDFVLSGTISSPGSLKH